MSRILAFILLLLPSVLTFGQSSGEEKLREEANSWFESKEFAKAFPAYSQLVSLHPRDPDLNFRFGTTALYAGEEKSKAIKHLKFAVQRNCADARVHYYLGKAYHLNYEFALAKDSYQEYIRKKDPKTKEVLPAQRYIQMCNQGSQLLSNIRDIVVLEKTNASAQDFFRYYNLAEIGGRVIATPEQLLSKYDQKAELVSVMHFPGNALTIYFTSYGKKGESGKDIYKADILPGGEFSEPERLPSTINTVYDEDYAFMHPDGKTFYFASKGHNSMGGYDVFKSEFNPYTGQFGDPVNLDFAINTPDDDLFYVVDSLKKTAYFASSRNSAQNEVNVYKVMVKSIPVNLTFIKGDYFAEVPNISDKATLKVIDELTGKPVYEGKATTGSEAYLMDLPKAGLYRLELLPEGGAIAHTGTFQVPDYGKTVALKQELKIIEEGGQQRLVITNSFQEPLDESIAELSAEVLRRKQGLDVNVTDEILEELEEQGEGSLREAINEEDIASVAGFDTNVTLETLKEELEETADESEVLAPQLETRAAALLKESLSDMEEASSILKEAESTMSNVNKEDTEAYVTALTKFQELMLQGEEKQRSAQNKLATSQSLMQAKDELLAKAENRNETLVSLNAAVNAGNMDDAVAVLTRYKEVRDQNSNDSFKVIQDTEKEKDAAAQNQLRMLDRITELRAEEKELETRLTRTNNELNLAKKKSLKTQLQQDIDLITNQLVDIDSEIQDKTRKAENYRTSEEDFTAQINIFQNKVDDATPAGNDKYDQVLAETIQVDLKETKRRISVLEIDDPEALALLDQRTKATRNDIALMDKLGPNAVASNVELKPIQLARTEWDQAVLAINEQGVSAEVKTQYLNEETASSLSNQIAFLEKIDRSDLSEVEIEELDREIQDSKQWLSEFDTQSQQVEQTVFNTVEERESAISNAFPNYETQEQSFEEGEDTQAWVSQTEENNRQLELIEERIAENTASILASDDAAEVEALNAETQNLKAARSQILNEDPLQSLETAWQNDLRYAMEDEPDNFERLNAQAQATQQYIAGLELIQSNTNQGIEDQKLESKLDEALIKLDTYEADMELALSTNEEPIDDATDSSVEDASELEFLSNQEEATIDPETESNFNTPAETEEESFASVEEEIAELQTQIDAAQTDEEKEQIQLKINELKAQAEEDLTTEIVSPGEVITSTESAENIDTAEATEAVSEVTTIESSSDVIQSIAKELTPFEPLTNDNYEDYQSYEIIEQELMEDESFQKVAAKLDEYENEISQKEAIAGNPEISASKKKKLDREVEKAYFEKADAEIDKSRRLHEEALVQFEKNTEDLALGLIQTPLSSETQDYLKRQQERALQYMNEAEQIRLEAAPEIDEIKQAYEFQRASALEIEALELQRRNAIVIDNQNEIASLAAEDQVSLAKGTAVVTDTSSDVASNQEDVGEITDSVEEDVTDQTEATAEPVTEEVLPEIESEVSEAAAETAEELNTNDTSEDTAVENSSSSEDVTENATTSENNTESANPEDVELTEASTVLADIIENKPVFPEITVKSEAVTPTDLPEEDDLLETWGSEDNWDPTFREAITRDATFLAYSEKRELLETRVDGRNNILRSRNAAAQDLKEIQERISGLESEVAADMTAEEKTFKAEQLTTLYRNAEVRYMEVEEADERLAKADKAIEEIKEEVANAFVALEAAEVVAEARGTTSPESIAPEEVAVTGFAALQPYLFAFPDVVESSIFGFVEGSPYSESTPIPLNPVLPTGVVYKVQVGAFRNAIPQDHFSEFAPLAGEELNNGITRYTAGLFIDYNSANNAKGQIRTRGYSDAFVVAFRDGKRISLAEARAESGDGPAIETAPEEIALEEGSAVSESISNDSSEGIAPASTPEVVENNSVEASGSTSVPETAGPPIADFAENWSEKTGEFYSVQIGVYSKPVSLDDLYNVNEVLAERTSSGYVRYTSGSFQSLEAANQRKEEARAKGITDAFVVAYRDGIKVSVSAISPKETQPQTTEPSVETEASRFVVTIGSFEGEVPSQVALALLLLESKWGINQTRSNGVTTYQTRAISQQEVERVKQDFENYEVEVESVQPL